ncbi:hypothetical protein SD37_26880 [Amycolatopsis orientalis]|uniref:Uncharacterized protein n=1 Tax=Amycolatopsis orientalis TaxID=31958 RepID=A0A193C3D7_AMYOR|nr:hypothetical protein SD37_26880 [Amycolatopsis orientalis]
MPGSPNGTNGPPPGGLVPILTSLLDEVGGAWLFSAGPADRRGDANERRGDDRAAWVPVVLPDQKTAAGSRRSAIELFLWLFHYLYDTSVEPSFDSKTRNNWRAYNEVNELFGLELAARHSDSEGEVVLVHDFHLMLVPARFEAATTRRNSTLAYFHHIPWCDPGYFGLLPKEVRDAILGSLLKCDFVGFHSRRWAENFKSCCLEHLPGVVITGDTAAFEDHLTRITVAPGPIDASTVRDLADSPLAHQWRESLATRAGDRRILVRVDRLDLWKNVVRGFRAYELLLERSRNVADEYWFCAIVSSPRFPTSRHTEYETLCRAAQDRINERFGGGAEAVSMIYPNSSDHHRTRALAALSMADVTLVNPTFDGLNMVAKEALAVNPEAPLLLSRNAGSFDQLAPAAVAVDPFDVLSTMDLMETALSRGADQTTEHRDACLAALGRESSRAWLDRILDG